MMGKLIQKKKFSFFHHYLFSPDDIGDASLTGIKYFYIIVTVFRKMGKTGMGPHIDEFPSLQHLSAVYSKIFSRCIERPVHIFLSGQKFFLLRRDHPKLFH